MFNRIQRRLVYVVCALLTCLLLDTQLNATAPTMASPPPLEPRILVENVVTFGDEHAASADEFRDYKQLIPLSQAEPEYPAPSRRAWQYGAVELSVSVKPDGNVDKVTIVHSPYAILSIAAEKAAKTWRFRPLKGGHPITGNFRITFQLLQGDGTIYEKQPVKASDNR